MIDDQPTEIEALAYGAGGVGMTPARTARVVTVHERTFSARVTCPDRASAALLRRAVPPGGREWDPTAGEWVVYGSRVPRLLAALRDAGYIVELIDVAS